MKQPNYDKAKQLFEMVDNMGETLDGELHIIDTTDEYPVEGEKKYRVYQKDGYCFDVSKEVEEETDDYTRFFYGFYAEWEGFSSLDIDKAIVLIKTA